MSDAVDRYQQDSRVPVEYAPQRHGDARSAADSWSVQVKVVVTGGAGFIGANVCRTLRQSGIQRVVALDDMSTGRKENLHAVDVELVKGSILVPDVLDEVFDGADAVVHLAARPSVPKSIADPVASHEVNTTGTLQVLEAVRRAGGPHIIVASSSSVYGANPAIPKREDLRPMPVSPYGAMKLATETYALAWGRSFDLDVLAFRFFNVFGPLQPADHAYAAVVPAFISAALDGRPLPVHGDGQQTRDFTFVDTVSMVIANAVRRRVTSADPVNLAFGSRNSLLDVIMMLEQILGQPLERKHEASRVGDVRDSQADQTMVRRLFPSIEPISLLTGLRRTVEWFATKA